MVNIAGSYDENAEPGQFERLPAGSYRAVIIESSNELISPNDASKGKCLKLTWKLETGPHDGRLFWQRLNLWPGDGMNNGAKVHEIANQQFAAVRQATGKPAPKDSEELHHIACVITIGPQKNNPEYDEVKSVKPAGPQPQRAATGGNAPARQADPGNGNAAPARTGGGSAPWRAPAA